MRVNRTAVRVGLRRKVHHACGGPWGHALHTSGFCASLSSWTESEGYMGNSGGRAARRKARSSGRRRALRTHREAEHDGGPGDQTRAVRVVLPCSDCGSFKFHARRQASRDPPSPPRQTCAWCARCGPGMRMKNTASTPRGGPRLRGNTRHACGQWRIRHDAGMSCSH